MVLNTWVAVSWLLRGCTEGKSRLGLWVWYPDQLCPGKLQSPGMPGDSSPAGQPHASASSSRLSLPVVPASTSTVDLSEVSTSHRKCPEPLTARLGLSVPFCGWDRKAVRSVGHSLV